MENCRMNCWGCVYNVILWENPSPERCEECYRLDGLPNYIAAPGKESKVPTPHRWADLIREWTKDPSKMIQVREKSKIWMNCSIEFLLKEPVAASNFEFRIKPEDKYQFAHVITNYSGKLYVLKRSDKLFPLANVRYTYEITGELTNIFLIR